METTMSLYPQYACTAAQYNQHQQDVASQPGVLQVRESESIHQGETDAFALAQSNDGATYIIGRQDHPLYFIFPLGMCPVIAGAGYYDSVNMGVKKATA